MPIGFLSLALLVLVFLGSIATLFLLIARRRRLVQPVDRDTQQFSATYTAESSLAFPPECGIRLVQMAIPGGSADIELVTRYTDGWEDIQGCLVVQADGNANTSIEPDRGLRE